MVSFLKRRDQWRPEPSSSATFFSSFFSIDRDLKSTWANLTRRRNLLTRYFLATYGVPQLPRPTVHYNHPSALALAAAVNYNFFFPGPFHIPLRQVSNITMAKFNSNKQELYNTGKEISGYLPHLVDSPPPLPLTNTNGDMATHSSGILIGYVHG